MRRPSQILVSCVALLGMCVLTTDASAKFIVDVSADPITNPTSVTVNSFVGGQFIVQNTMIKAAGSGNIDSFLRIQQTGFERGYNTSDRSQNGEQNGNQPPLNGVSGNFTRNLQLGEIPVVTIGGIQYREFILDVNQTANGPISLNQVQIFQGAAAIGADPSNFTLTDADGGSGPNGTGGNDAVISFGAAGTLRFQINDLSNNGTDLTDNREIWADTGNGSGTGDMFLYVRNSNFANDPNSYVTLFSQFGQPSGTYSSNAGFEEWFVAEFDRDGDDDVEPVPAPAGLVLLASAIPVLGLRRVLRRKTA